MKRAFFASTIIVFLVIAGFSPLIGDSAFIHSNGLSAPVGTCFPTGTNLTITTAILWQNLSCNYSGDLIFNGSSSLNMINSTLNVINASQLSFSELSVLNMTTSSLNIVNSTIRLNAFNLNVINSRITGTNTSKPAVLEASNSASFSNSEIQFTNISPQSLRLTGLNSLAISNTNVTDQITSTGVANTTLILGGGTVTVSGSRITSSDQGVFGFNSGSSSNLIATANSSLVIAQSSLISGATSALGYYNSSSLSIISRGNITVSKSLLQSEGQSNSTISFSARVPFNVPHYISILQTSISTLNYPGAILLQSNYGISLSSSTIYGNRTLFSVDTYEFIGLSTSITVPDPVGGIASLVNMYNSTYPSSIASIASSYAKYGYIIVHVLSNASSPQPIGSATVNLFGAYNNGQLEYQAVTNSSGWVQIPALISSKNSSGTINRQAYVAQASYQSLDSAQAIVVSNYTTYVNLTVPSMLKYTFSLQQYPALGGLGPVRDIQVISNGYPLNFQSNASNDQIIFQTVGNTGYTFSFVVLYPKNLSSVPVTVQVDGLFVPVQVSSLNSTYYSAAFSIPSGVHSVSLFYFYQNGNFEFQQYPYIIPGLYVVVAVVIVTVGGCLFLVTFLRRRRT